MAGKTIALLGTMDSKGEEFGFVKGILEKQGINTLVIDAGTFEPTLAPDIDAAEVAQAAGADLEALRKASDRGSTVTAMCQGAAVVVKEAFNAGRFDGIMSLGGSGGTSIAAAAMKELPVGVPKMIVSTLASGDTSAFVGAKDITMMYSVVDIAGLNKLSQRILANAAYAMAGMVQGEVPGSDDKPLVAATMFGVTTPCVEHARKIVEDAGYEVLVFHATGSGGKAMEELIREGYFAGVMDVSTTEWCDQLVGGVMPGGEDRLEAAAKAGIPQVVAPGALDMVNFHARDTVPDKFSDRNLYVHNPVITLMRTTPQECAQLGRIIASKLNMATGPVTFFWPAKGVSMIDAQGQPFHDPEADQAFIECFKETINENVALIEMDCHINDPEFAEAMAQQIIGNLESANK